MALAGSKEEVKKAPSAEPKKEEKKEEKKEDKPKAAVEVTLDDAFSSSRFF